MLQYRQCGIDQTGAGFHGGKNSESGQRFLRDQLENSELTDEQRDAVQADLEVSDYQPPNPDVVLRDRESEFEDEDDFEYEGMPREIDRVLYDGDEEIGGYNLRESDYARRNIETAFPGFLREGEKTMELHGIALWDESNIGKGYGRQMWMDMIKTNPNTAFYNSQLGYTGRTDDPAVISLQRMADRGYIELRWRDRPGGPFVFRRKHQSS